MTKNDETVRLLKLKGLSEQEIAEELDWSVDRVYDSIRRRRGRRRMSSRKPKRSL